MLWLQQHLFPAKSNCNISSLKKKTQEDHTQTPNSFAVEGLHQNITTQFMIVCVECLLPSCHKLQLKACIER